MAWEQTHVNGTKTLSRAFDKIIYNVTLGDRKLLELSLTDTAGTRTYLFNSWGGLARAVVGDIQYEGFIPPEVRPDSRTCDRLITLPISLVDQNNLELCISHLEERSYS